MQNSIREAEHKKTHHRKIYAISVAGDHLANVKFGLSSDPVSRMADLQIGCPVMLELLSFCDGTYPVEQAIHQFLADSWHHGEWFSRNEKVIGVIHAIRENRVKHHIGTHVKDPPAFVPQKRDLILEVRAMIAGKPL